MYNCREGTYFENELHLAGLDFVHLCLLEHLVVAGIGGLTDVDDPPGQIYIALLRMEKVTFNL